MIVYVISEVWAYSKFGILSAMGKSLDGDAGAIPGTDRSDASVEK
jgi:hypothetical protein